MTLDSRTTLAFFQRRSLEAVVLHLEELGLGTSEAKAAIADLRVIELVRADELPSLLSVDAEMRRLQTLRYVVNSSSGRNSSPGLSSTIRSLAELKEDRFLVSVATLVGCIDWLREERFNEAITALEAVDCGGNSPLALVLDAMIQHWLGFAYQQCGDFRRATRKLLGAIEACDQNELCFGASYRFVYGGLLLSAGQFRAALGELSNGEFRRAAAKQGDVATLIHSHLMASEAALYLQVLAKANYELAEAKDLIDTNPDVFRQYGAYLVLLSAKLDTLWGNKDEGKHLFRYAIELFEQLEPPFYTGILYAKLGLVEFALREQDYDTVFARTAELLMEAEERGCIDARTRLLGFQARLLLDDGAPSEHLKEAYEDLVSRVHLMNNPSLTFMAYADLYAFARRRLDAREQKFWLDRLSGLKKLLDRSCYEDLYGSYVLDRYRREIEGGLDELDGRFDFRD